MGTYTIPNDTTTGSYAGSVEAGQYKVQTDIGTTFDSAPTGSNNTGIKMDFSYIVDSDDPDSFGVENIKLNNSTQKLSKDKYTYEDDGEDKTTKAIYDGGVTNKKTIALDWESASDGLGTGIKEYKLFVSDIKRDGKDIFNRYDTTEDSYSILKDLKDGKYQWYVEAIDNAGNKTRTDKYTFKIDTKKPDTNMLKVTSLNDNPLNIDSTTEEAKRKIKLGSVDQLNIQGQTESNTTPYVEIYNRDKSIKYQEIKCDEGSSIGGNVSVFTCQSQVSIANSPYTFVIYAKDKAGNKSDGFDLLVN